MSRKDSSRIADRKMEKSVWASTQHCLTPFVTLHDFETSAILTFAIIPVCRGLIIVVNASGQPYFLSSCHSPILPTLSNALLKLTNTMYSGRSCSLHLSCSVCRQFVEEDHSDDLACYGKKRDYSSSQSVQSPFWLQS